MGRNTEIYMFDKEKASVYLYDDLKHKKFHTRTFKTFLEDRKKETGKYDITLENILEKVKNDMNTITPDELFEINLFLIEEVYSEYTGRDDTIKEKYFEELYDHYGIILLYEIPTSTVCTSYMFQFGNYTHYFPISESENSDGGINMDSTDFLKFNDYTILLMKMILDKKMDGYEYEFTKSEEDIIQRITADQQNNLILLKEIEHECDFIKDCSADEKGPYAQTIYYAYAFFKQFIEMKLRINADKNPRIVILDS
ncbi:hypothetical protein EG346_11435 [Chryseobacterium carnipullorum]|uniref:Uncharacterized protein n=2 Tax=Chryseobacterium carnipullorum TaxID=1124835 RepID=A0A3G6NFG5_CHRCU|nr:hypothetical protein [Chryseobacterium carnipullorum]AZA48751.1 hypothetical protein EG346_11435 [Chryseobacterium carnipullorum]AZA63663.1 hypothetical protein EG345_02335 [Chryseobacterium carnipullorum]